MKKENCKEISKQTIEIEILAERIKLLWALLGELIPYKEKLKDVAEEAGKRSSMTLSIAPILGAFGQNYEEVHLQKEIERKRAEALYNLINVLDETEKERKEFAEKKIKKAEGLAQIHKALGL